MTMACDKCNEVLAPLTLYSPELLKIFVGGRKEYSRQGILSHWSICINANCEDGKMNVRNYNQRRNEN